MRFSKLSNRGVALLTALAVLVLIMYMAMEVSYETNVDYIINSQQVNRLKARYAAKAGAELSLLRISLYQKAVSQFGKQLGEQSQMLDMLWSFPFAWPPVLGDELSTVDKDQIKGVVGESLMDAQYFVSIEDAGSKFDINDLASESKALREVTRKQLSEIFSQRLETDDDWARENRDLRYEEIINNIQDWVDADTESLNGGNESQLYANIRVKDSEVKLPPNRHFITLGELRMVAGITDEIYDLLSQRVTIYGQKGVNPNYATKEVIMSLDASISADIADEIINRRNDPREGPFKDEADFAAFVQSKGGSIPTGDTQDKVPLVFDPPFNFKIRSNGQFGNSTVEIEAITYDMASVSARVVDFLKKENPDSTNESPQDEERRRRESANPNAAPIGEKKPGPKGGRPNVVFWLEK